jgi:hypothetical protein
MHVTFGLNGHKMTNCPKFVEIVNSQGKLIIIDIFMDIGKQMLETNYTLNLRQLLKITSKIKRYL